MLTISGYIIIAVGTLIGSLLIYFGQRQDSEADKVEIIESTKKNIDSAAKRSDENFEVLSKQIDNVIIRLDNIDRKTIPIDEVINSAIDRLEKETTTNTEVIQHIKDEFTKFQTETRDQFFADQNDRTRNYESLKSSLDNLSTAVNDLTSDKSKSMVSEAIAFTTEYLEKGTYIEAPTGNGHVNLELSVNELKNDSRVTLKEKLSSILDKAATRKAEERNIAERQLTDRVQIAETYSLVFLTHYSDIESFLESYMKELKSSGLEIRITDERSPFDPHSFVQKAKEVLNKQNLQERIRTYEIQSSNGLRLNVYFDATFYWEKLDRGFNPFGMHLYGDEVKGFGTRSWGIDIQKDGKLWGGRGASLDVKELNSLMEMWILDEKFWH